MTERGTLPWLVIRQEDDGSRYRVGRYATLDEARELAERLTGHAEGWQAARGREHFSGTEAGDRAGEARTVSATRVRRYVVERLDYPNGDHA